MLPLADQVLELLSLEQTLLCTYAISALLLAALALLLHLLLQLLGFFHRYYVNCQRLRCFPEPQRRNWLLGHLGMVQSTEEGLQSFEELVRHYSHSCLWWLGPWRPIVRLFHPEAIKPVLQASVAVVPKDPLFYGFLKPWLGEGLLLSNGQRWGWHRHMLTPAFHFNILKPYVKIFNQSTNIMHAKWRRLVLSGSPSLDIFEQLGLMTLDSLQKCIFSHHSDCQE
ncbi:PREDICTED: cytochrome P450 4F22-like [Gavialis gangeticus]|uniref:cytochrome P450 4F22-like n=1 Tax=Gavialis gangeticus TaxID=94835 RepID=UPI00092F5B41|nr:PREDICTED: cytochrome P450 4F22-like [Gavialis gangeticus]